MWTQAKIHQRSILSLSFGIVLIFSLSACFGPDVENGTGESDSNFQNSAPFPSSSPSSTLDVNIFTFASLCSTPDSLIILREESDLVDRGLLGATDIEQSLKTLGLELIHDAEWSQSSWEEMAASYSDKALLNDYFVLGEEILRARLDLISGSPASIKPLITKAEALSKRSELFCTWVDENS